MSQLNSKVEGTWIQPSSTFLFFFRPSMEHCPDAHSHLEGPSAVISPPIQMLIPSFPEALTNALRSNVYQSSGQPMAQSRWHMKWTITGCLVPQSITRVSVKELEIDFFFETGSIYPRVVWNSWSSCFASQPPECWDYRCVSSHLAPEIKCNNIHTEAREWRGKDHSFQSLLLEG
jgi:hypothetical protein